MFAAEKAAYMAEASASLANLKADTQVSLSETRAKLEAQAKEEKRVALAELAAKLDASATVVAKEARADAEAALAAALEAAREVQAAQMETRLAEMEAAKEEVPTPQFAHEQPPPPSLRKSKRRMPCPTRRTHAVGLWVAHSTWCSPVLSERACNVRQFLF